MLISIIIPIYNEEQNIQPLYTKLQEAMEPCEFAWEVIFINDGSLDSSGQKLEGLSQVDKRIKVINFRKNYGQTAAMMAGFDFAAGQLIVSMDGDLQNDPNDIPRLIAKIEEGYDICSGWRKNRKDNFFIRNLPSWLANKLISALSGVNLHDYGCTLKAYKADILKELRLYGEMHRFIPIYASWQGARIAEVPVNHHPRTSGKSKYGLERTYKVFLDLLFVLSFLTLFSKPMYIFGGFGIANMGLSFSTFLLMMYYKFWGDKTFVETPLPQLVVLFFLVGFISILMGFMAEIMMRTYYESQSKSIYSIKSALNMDDKA